MKMSVSLILGILFIFIGVSFIVKVFFKIDFPVFKIFIAVFFIYLGFKILFGSFTAFNIKSDSNSAIFSELNYNGSIEDKTEYSAVFGKVTLDLQDIVLTEPETTIKVNAVFGGADIYLPSDLAVKIKSDVVFGGVQLPNKNSGGFGSAKYESTDFETAPNQLIIEVNAVFAGVKIHQY